VQRSEAGQVLKADKHWVTLPHTLHHMALSQPKTDTGWQANLRHAHWQLVLSCMPPPVTGCAVICTQVQLSSHLDCRSAVFASAGLERRMRAYHSASQGGNALVSTQSRLWLHHAPNVNAWQAPMRCWFELLPTCAPCKQKGHRSAAQHAAAKQCSQQPASQVHVDGCHGAARRTPSSSGHARSTSRRHGDAAQARALAALQRVGRHQPVRQPAPRRSPRRMRKQRCAKEPRYRRTTMASRGAPDP